MENKENLIGVIKTLFKFKKLILMTCGAVFIGSIVVALLLPVYYKSTTTFYAASPDFTNPDKMFGGGNTDFEYYGNSEDIERMLTIASSCELVEFMIEKFNLYDHYEMDSTGEKSAFYIAEHFNGLYNIQKTKYDAIELSIEDKDRELSAEMTNAARKEIESIYLRLIRESQNFQISSVSLSINEGDRKLQILTDTLMQLREKYSIYDIETQGETISSLFANAMASTSKMEGKYEALKNSPNVPRDSLSRAKVELEASKKQVENLKKNINLFNQGSSVVSIMSDQHEKARTQLAWDIERLKRIQAAFKADAPVLHVVQEAQIPIVKERPTRSIIVLASTIFAFLLLVIGLLLFDYYRDVDWKEIVNG